MLQPAAVSDCRLCSDEGAEHGGNARLKDGDLACQATLGQEEERGDAAKARAENDAGHGREVSPAYQPLMVRPAVTVDICKGGTIKTGVCLR